MSMKVYQAYRYVGKNIWKDASRWRDLGFREWKKVVLDVYVKSFYSLREADKESDIGTLKMKVHREITERYREASSQPYRDYFDFDMGLSLRKVRGKYLILPHAGALLANAWHQALHEESLIEDYSYWDNTDKPEHIPEKQWLARRRDWLAADANWSMYFFVEVSAYSSWVTNSPLFSEEFRALRDPLKTATVADQVKKLTT